MSTALENRQQGERLEQLDPPSLPQTPSEPKRPLIIAIGTGIGLILGLCLAGAREVKDTRAQESEGCSSLHPASRSRQHSAARERSGGAAPQAAGLAGLVHRLSGGRGDHVRLRGVLLRHEAIGGRQYDMSRVHDALRRAETGLGHLDSGSSAPRRQPMRTATATHRNPATHARQKACWNWSRPFLTIPRPTRC